MRSSTHNPINQSVMADMRLQALIRKEMNEHQHIISSYQKEMQFLRDSLTMAMERFESLFNHLEKEFKDKIAFLNHILDQIQEKVKDNQISSLHQKNTLTALHEQIQASYSLCTQKNEMDSFKKVFSSQINECNSNHLNIFQTYQQEMKALFQPLKEEVMKIKNDLEQKFCELSEKIESKFSLSKMDKDGVLKEVRVYEKSMFIIEKKIENIYTLIERINKREATCPKLA